MKNVTSLILTLDNLTKVPRTGGVLFSGVDPNRTDSIAEHSFKVSYIALFLAKIAKKKGLLQVNLENLLVACLSHDWTDCILLDIPSGSPSYKSYFEENIREITKKAETKANHKIEDYIDDETGKIHPENFGKIETDILEISDVIALLTEILQWKFDGLNYDWFDYIWSNTIARVKSKIDESKMIFFLDIVLDLEEIYKKGSKPVNPFLTIPQFQTFK